MGLPKADSSYFFNGHLFGEYINVKKFKEDIKNKTSLKFEENIDLPSLYQYIVQTKPGFKSVVDKILFENILYSYLKNVFVNNISLNPPLTSDLFKQKMKHLIEELNYTKDIPSNFYAEMKEDGFYLMDALNITVPRAKFIAGFDIEEENEIVKNLRLLFVEVVLREGKPVYFIAGVDIDFTNRIALVLIRNLQGISKTVSDSDEEFDNTVNRLYHRVLDSVFKKLGIGLEKIDVDRDREGMYKFCKELDDALLNDIREEVKSKTESVVADSVKKLNKVLFPNENRLNNADKKDLSEKIQSLLLSYYINYNVKADELVMKAKELNLVGYPTKVKFMDTNSTKSSTQSGNSKQPVSAIEAFHSLYFNFKQALELENWSISWFTDYEFKNARDLDVIQTTIYSTRNSFRVVFLPTRPLNKEIVHHVIRTINSYR